CARVQTNFDFW
nr:immunoglobulin heavy chain junction region [Macaca mulatta]MOV86657.1 immunoglobulin heavy chain junction region [Macaca mulatta]MOV86688.1 immunoglobulin heavy chain junction region [Macaca mulatta]MOV86810.1 immunoglobulin heavy chain junction region [Macaca mulatta]MOV86909.1 immunoglobulin heavy chain junction region [Macaca mulatta]